MYKWQVDITYHAPVMEDIAIRIFEQSGFEWELCLDLELMTDPDVYSTLIITHCNAAAETLLRLQHSYLMEDMRITPL
jgi:hypothetical protein